MFFDEDDEGEVSFGESSDAEREMTPDIPKAPSVKTFDDDGDFSAAGDVDSDTLRAFVVAVIYANVAVLLVALGPLVWYFEGWGRIGAGLLAVGLVAGVRTYQTYRAWDRSRDDGDADEAGENDDTNADAGSTDADAGSTDADAGPADDDADVDPVDEDADVDPVDEDADVDPVDEDADVDPASTPDADRCPER